MMAARKALTPLKDRDVSLLKGEWVKEDLHLDLDEARLSLKALYLAQRELAH
jgi:hypothetical protein